MKRSPFGDNNHLDDFNYILMTEKNKKPKNGEKKNRLVHVVENHRCHVLEMNPVKICTHL